jgi:CO/xanthine dehydrogenase FAD-binding subunit
MNMRFEYLEPESIESAIGLLEQYKGRARILAGGTDLVVQMRQRIIRPDFVIHIGLIQGLDYISFDSDGGVGIGTLATMRMVEKSEVLKGSFEILRQGAAQVSCPQIRNVATLGGNSCNGVPSADTVPPLIALGTEAMVIGPKGERKIPLEEFHRGPGRTVLKADELLVGFKIPSQPALTGASYFKYTPRGTSELAVVGVAALLTLSPGNGVCEKARIVLGACGPTPLRAKKAESVLLKHRIDEALIEKAAQTAAGEARPNPGVSVRASAAYRRMMVRVWCKRALEDAMRRALS